MNLFLPLSPWRVCTIRSLRPLYKVGCRNLSSSFGCKFGSFVSFALDYRKELSTMDKTSEEKQGAAFLENKTVVTDEKEMIKNKEKEILEELGPPPEKPLPGDCCGTGCATCIWDLYYDELKLYNSRKAELLSK